MSDNLYPLSDEEHARERQRWQIARERCESGQCCQASSRHMPRCERRIAYHVANRERWERERQAEQAKASRKGCGMAIAVVAVFVGSVLFGCALLAGLAML